MYTVHNALYARVTYARAIFSGSYFCEKDIIDISESKF